MLVDLFLVVLWIKFEVIKELCIVLNRELLNILVILSMWNGCIRMLCLVWNIIMKLKVLEIFKGILLEKFF